MLPFALAVLALQHQEPKISVTTRLVEVSVVAQDKKGGPVGDLSVDDFEALDNGRPQRIRIFLKETASQDARGTAPLPPNVYSNRAPAADGSPKSTRMTTVLFDALNTPWQFRNFAGKHLDKFVKSFPADEPVSVLLLSPAGLRILHGEKSYRRAQFREDQLLTGTGETPAEERQADMYTDNRVRVTLRALETIARNLSGVSGRKNLIWITGGIPTRLNSLEPPGSLRDRRSYTSEYRAALLALNRASVAVYLVDARGLEAVPATKLLYGAQDPYTAAAHGPALQKYQQYRTGMTDLADETGGKAYFDRNDIDRAASEAAGDARISYTLAYYQPDEPDDKWHKVEVRARRDGVALRHRTGYLAVRDERADDSDTVLRRAVTSPLDATAIGLNGTVENGPGGRLRALLQIDPGNVAFAPEGKGYRCHLQVVTVIRDSAGDSVDTPQIDSLDLPLEGEALRQTQANGVLFRKEFAANEKAIDVRFAVRDRITGLVGSLSIPVRSSVNP